jgi:hypothetical protein
VNDVDDVDEVDDVAEVDEVGVVDEVDGTASDVNGAVDSGAANTC